MEVLKTNQFFFKKKHKKNPLKDHQHFLVTVIVILGQGISNLVGIVYFLFVHMVH